MKTLSWFSSGVLALAFAMGFATPGRSDTGNNPAIGSLNYVEGQVSINGQALTAKSVGTAQLEKGQTLETQDGKAELLLTPGVFLRLDDNSSVQMISPSLVPTVVELDKGRAMLEVSFIQKQDDIRVNENGASTKILKKGLYDFDANGGVVRAFKGRATVYDGNRKTDVFTSYAVALNAPGKLKSKSFKTSKYQDDFYNWSKVRSGYVLEADADLAGEHGDGSSYAPGWYWDPGFSAWAFPYDWGWGFYSPFYGYGFPYGYGGYGWGGFGPYGYRGWYGPRGIGPRLGRGEAGGFHGGGFHQSGGFSGGGGFHGGGGGFHGGGGGVGGGHR